jgi:hypothetical protein
MILVGSDYEHGNDDCSWPDSGGFVSGYCFADLSEEQRLRFEAHLLECPRCWAEVERLDSFVAAVRTDRSLTGSFNAGLASTIGISARVHKPWSGLWRQALTVSVLFGIMMAISLVMEIAYAYPAFSSFAVAFTPVVFVSMTVTALVALWINARMTGRFHARIGLISTVTLLLGGVGITSALVGTHLPTYPLTQASFHTWTAQAAFLKDALYCTVFTVVFGILPFHFVAVLQHELAQGRCRRVLHVLTRAPLGIAPIGTAYLGVWVLCVFLILGAVASVLSTAHLLEALQPSAFENLFIETILSRWVVFLALGIECCCWYYSALNELRRESTVRTEAGANAC